MKKTTIPLLILLMVALLGGLALVKQNQDTRRGASFANTKLMLLPSTRIERKIGEELPVKLYFLTESGAKVDGVQSEVCWGSHLKLDESKIMVNTQNGFDSNPIILFKNNCVTLVATSKSAADNLKTTGEVFTLNFEAISEGEGTIIINKESSMVTGDNSASATDKVIAVTAVENTTYKISGSSQTCETNADCPPGYECYQPPTPTCPPGENCLDVLPPKYCRPIISTNCSRCSTVFKYMRVSWNAVDCSIDPISGSSSAEADVVRTYDASCTVGNDPLQCSRCSRVNDKEYVWWLREADKTCDDDPAESQTVYRAYKEDCHLISSDKWPVLNYRVQYAFVKKDDSKCFKPQDWPLRVIVLGEGESKVYSNVVPQIISDSDEMFVNVGGSLVLEGFSQTDNVAVFMKGPKHLQMKYAIDKQETRYDKAGGELSLTKSVETSPIYDFTAYPILSGDVIGNKSENPDGVVNGFDYVYIKSKAKIHETVEDGNYLKADLDGSCQVNSNDLQQIRKTLEEKQGELY